MHKQDNIYFYSRNVPEKPTYVFSFSVGPIAVCAILNDPPVDTHDRFMFIPHNHAFFECQLIEKGPVYLSAQNNEYTIVSVLLEVQTMKSFSLEFKRLKNITL